MSSTARSKKCSACALRGRRCERQFHSDKEWDDLQRGERKVAADLEEAQQRLFEYSQKMNQAVAKIFRLQKHQQFLKDRGGRMLDHDQAVTEQLNVDDPPSAEELREFDRLAEQRDIRQLAATSGDASLSRMIASLDQFPPSFWDGIDASLMDAGGTVAPAGGSPSGSQ